MIKLINPLGGEVFHSAPFPSSINWQNVSYTHQIPERYKKMLIPVTIEIFYASACHACEFACSSEKQQCIRVGRTLNILKNIHAQNKTRKYTFVDSSYFSSRSSTTALSFRTCRLTLTASASRLK